MLHGNCSQVNSLEATDIDGGRGLTLGINAFSEGVDAAGRAKVMLDHVLVEGIGREVFFRTELGHSQWKAFGEFLDGSV